MAVFYWIYNIIFIFVALPVLIVVEFCSILSGKSSLPDLLEKLGFANIPVRRGTYRILLHGVSAGEVASLEPLLQKLESTLTNCEIVISTGTQAGRAIAKRLQSQTKAVAGVFFIPWDASLLLDRWIRRLQIDLAGIVETEIWPGLYRTCQNRGVPLVILNGRITERAVRLYAPARLFFHWVVAKASWIGVQNREEKLHYLKVGAEPSQIEILGNLKIDAQKSNSIFPLDGISSSDLIVIAGSTHEGEERLIVDAVVRLRSVLGQPVRLILAPRRIERISSLMREVKDKGLLPVRYSVLNRTDWDVLLLDCFGLLAAAYSVGDLAIIGGSFVPRGGHNFLEAVVKECPVMVGPYTHDIDSALKPFQRSAAICQVRRQKDLHPQLKRLAMNPSIRIGMSQRASKILEKKRGAVHLYAKKLIETLKPGETLSG